jgi:predicted signal transduction protein with EAL and GGDEF domain
MSGNMGFRVRRGKGRGPLLDLGTGYSSLSDLQMFAFDKIKIDTSFVVAERGHCGAIICAITGLARSLDIETSAEGAEVIELVDLLNAARCTQVRGYLFGWPRPLADLDFCGPARGHAAAPPSVTGAWQSAEIHPLPPAA